MISIRVSDLDFGIRWISIDRPAALNALNRAVLSELAIVLRETAEKSAVRVVVLSGEGEKAFIAGADIVEMSKMSVSEAVDFARLGHNVTRLLEEMPAPTIAAVHGYALGGGTELALACDFILATEKATFGLPEVSLGVIPGFGGTFRLMKRVGLASAKELIFSGKKINAQESLALGLVNQVFEQDGWKTKVLEVAKGIARQSSPAVQKAKKLMNEFSETYGIHYKSDAEIQTFSNIFGSADQKEGMKAFNEKRKPSFEGLPL